MIYVHEINCVFDNYLSRLQHNPIANNPQGL